MAWRARDSVAVPRVRGRELQRRRAALFARQPWCVLCLEAGRHTRPTIRDHVRALEEGGADDTTNEQALCAACSRAKTAAESQRGAARARLR